MRCERDRARDRVRDGIGRKIKYALHGLVDIRVGALIVLGAMLRGHRAVLLKDRQTAAGE